MTHAPTPTNNPSTGKKIFAWSAVVLGVFFILVSATDGDRNFVIAGICSGLIFLIPGAWYLFHARREAAGATPRKRHWWAIVAVCVGLGLVIDVVAPDEQQGTVNTIRAEATASVTSSAPETTSSTVTSSRSSEAQSSKASISTEKPQEPTAEQPDPQPVQEPEQPTSIAEQPAAPALVQQEVPPAYEEPVQPAPESVGGGYVGNCADIGHRVYYGDGIYQPKHDRDGDGIGCESYPEN